MSRMLAAVVAVLMSWCAFAQPACPSVQWTLGQGSESFASGTVREIATVDYDEDGKLDVVGVVEASGSSTLAWWKGNGDRTFGSRNDITSLASRATNIVIADATGDGRAEVIVGVANQTVLVLPATGSGRGAMITSVLTVSPLVIFAANRDADAEVELFVTDAVNSRFAVYDDIDTPTATELTRIQMTVRPQEIVAADFDGDGRSDIAVASDAGQRLDLYFGKVDGTYDAPVALPAVDPYELQVGDLDEDGLPDLVAGNMEYDFSVIRPATVSIYRNQGSRTFTHSTFLMEHPPDFGSLMELLLEDVSGDGHLDLVARATSSPLEVTTAVGRGDGTFRTPTYRVIDAGGSAAIFPRALSTGDFDGDGSRELAFGASLHFYTATASCATQVDLYTVSPLVSTGKTATLLAEVSGFSSDTAAPLGSVTLREGATDLQTQPVDANGQVTFSITGLTAGQHLLSAHFSGNADVAAGFSNVVTQNVTDSTTAVIITLPPLPKAYGEAFPIDIHIDGTANGYPGNVRVAIDGVEQWHFTSKLLQVSLEPGPHSISAVFEGTNVSPASESEVIPFTIDKALPGIVADGALTVRQGSAHAFTFTVTGAGAQKPSGTLQLIEGTTVIASGTLASGLIALNATLSRGAHDVRIVYGGDARYLATETSLTLEVLPNVDLAIEARGLANGVHIAYVLPTDTNMNSIQLLRRSTGSGWAPVAWNMSSGMDTTVPSRGVVYEYQLTLQLTNGTSRSSAIDSALMFNNDLLATGMKVRRTHFNELRTAINLMRTQAGLAAFQFDVSFDAAGIVRTSHLAGLRTALAEARAQLGMSTPTFSGAGQGTLIRATHVQELRELAR